MADSSIGRLPTAGRLTALDSMRGIAAAVVLLFHCLSLFPGYMSAAGNPLHIATWTDPWVWLRYTPLRLLTLGPGAVNLFFVLSGLVLSLPMLAGKQPPYPQYLLKRVCRIYLPFAVAILLSACLYLAIHPVPVPGVGEIVNGNSWNHPLTVDNLAGHLLMTGLASQMGLDNVMWSLVYELRISIFLPLLFIVTRHHRIGTLAAALALYVICGLIVFPNTDGESWTADIAATGLYVFLFVLGILLAGAAGRIRATVRAWPARGRVGLLMVGLLLVLTPTALKWLFPPLTGAGAVCLIALALGSATAERLLLLPPLVWLGRVSYSLYLFHLPLVLAAVHLLGGYLPLWGIVALVIPGSLLLAELAYRWVEMPAIQLGRRIQGVSGRRLGAAR